MIVKLSGLLMLIKAYSATSTVERMQVIHIFTPLPE